MSASDELKELISDFTKDLSGLLPDPATWGIWMVYMVELLEKRAADTEQPNEHLDDTLEVMRKAITATLERHQS